MQAVDVRCRGAQVAALRALCARATGDDGAETLHALVDGLALHAVLAPDVTTPARQVELLDAYLGGRSPSAAARSVASTVLP